MNFACPKTPEDIPAVTLLWEEFSGVVPESSGEPLSEEEVAKALFIDKTRLVTALAVMQASVACRAVRACDVYFDWMKKRAGTDKQTYLRPRIRIDSRYQTVEMSWVRRLSKSHVTRRGESVNEKGKVGRAFFVNTNQGSVTVFSWYDYLKRGTKDRYSDSIFSKEPAWVQQLGRQVEDRFELLRKEQKIITSIKRLIGTLNQIQTRQFNDRVNQLLIEWGAREIKSLYQPEISLTANADE